MKKLFLCGRSEAGKTSLTQAMKGEKLWYHKTQFTDTWDITIDTPGEATETKRMGVELGTFSFDSDVIGLLVAANEPFNLFPPACIGVTTRPIIGIITKIDLPDANVPMVKLWLEQAGCERVFCVSNVTGEGIDELVEFLNEQSKVQTIESVKENQKKGLKDWA